MAKPSPLLALLLLVFWTQPDALGQAGRFRQYDAQANALLKRMTLAEKVGQMTQAELSHLESFHEIKELALGSVLSGGNSDPEKGNSLTAWTDAYDNCQRQAIASRLGIPILYGIDAVHGHSNVNRAVIFPHNIGLGCAGDPELVREINRITALEIRATGINWNFAPCVAVPRDLRWGRTYEGFGELPTLVSRLGVAAVEGLQGESLAGPLSVLACAKHFIGDGGTEAVVREADWEGFGDGARLRLDQGNTKLEEAMLRRLHLAPYIASIEAGVGTVMPSYSSWNGVKCSASHELLTEILKGELGFEGFLISDYNAIDQIAADYKEAIRISVNAGMDMFMVPSKYGEFMDLLTDLVDEGSVPQTRIDDAVRRILRVKAAMGLLAPDASPLANRDLHQAFGSAAHRQVARRAVRESLVLLKNEGNLLPLDKQAERIVVAGRAADDIGIQCGGWTIDWQGGVGHVIDGGATLLTALRAAVDDGAVVEYSPDGSAINNADVAVVVVGERPYAEGNGDTADLTLPQEDQTVLNRAEASGVPVVLVVLSGRPLDLGDSLNAIPAIVAAWLPGTEGAGVADVLFGDFAPTGKLSFTWPRTTAQEPINAGDAEYDPAFPVGFGLTYGDSAE